MASYLLILSSIKHKESWFLLPVIPLVLLQLSFFFRYLYGYLKLGKFKGILIYIIVLNFFGLIADFTQGKGYLAVDYIIDNDPNPESVMFLACYPARDYIDFHWVENPVSLFGPYCDPRLNRTMENYEWDLFIGQTKRAHDNKAYAADYKYIINIHP